MCEKQKVRYGVVGSGWIVDAMIAGAKQYDDLELTAVYSRTEERAGEYAAQHGAAYTFTDLEQMAASNVIDMVYIASPNVLHMQQTEIFLRHGKHVLCEKPMTAFPGELQKTYAVAEQHGCLLSEAIMMLFQPQLRILTDALQEIGDISFARFDFSQFSSKYPAYAQGETPNIFNPEMETGALQDLGVYCVYPAITLFGEPQSLTASAWFMRTGADGVTVSDWRYADKQVVLTCSKVGEAAAPSEIIGTHGSVTVDSISKLENIVLHLRGQAPKTLWTAESKETLMGREIETFAQWVKNGKTPAYEMHKQMSLEVTEYLYRIRQAANITFPRDI